MRPRAAPSKPRPTLRQLAASRLRAGDLKAAQKLYSRLSHEHPDAEIWLTLGQIHAALDEPDTAIKCLRRATEQHAQHPGVSTRIAELLFELGLIEESLGHLRRAFGKFPNHPQVQLMLAQALEDAGERDEAMSAYRQALALRPQWAGALGGLLRVAREHAEPAWIEQARALLADSRQPDDDRAVLGYGLGRVFERKNMPDDAFAAWRQANTCRRKITGALNRAAARAHIDSQIERYPGGLLATPAQLEHPDRVPVFIVGMPRSGTTLLEQMLSAHPDAHGYGELAAVSMIAKDLDTAATGVVSGRIADRYPPKALQQAVDSYYHDLERRAATQARFTIDKAPFNFFHAGLISLLFPHSKIIVCRRDPRDVCLSIYAENFGLEQAFATDLNDLACFYLKHERLIRHWFAAIPDRLREIHYERLVETPEAELKPLLSWLGMEWNERCLEFHRHPKAVLTPSRWQVRSPLYRTSAGRWRSYRRHIEPLLKAFGRD